MLPQANIDTYLSQIFWLGVAFFLLYFCIAKFIMPRMENILIHRQKTIDDDLSHAHLVTEKISQLKFDYENSLLQLYKDVDNIKLNALNQLNISYEKRKLKLMQDLDKLKTDNAMQISQDVTSFSSSSKEAVIEVAKVILQRIFHQNPDAMILEKCYKIIRRS